MRDVLLVIWIALLGVTRLDLGGGAAGFLLTPFLAVTALVIVVEMGVTAGRGGRFELPGNTTAYFVLVSALIGVVLLSTFLSEDTETAGRRFALLFVQVYSVLIGALALANRPSPERLLLRGAYAGLSLSLVFNLVQIVVWFRGNPLRGLAAQIVNLELSNYAGIIPRLTGAAHDPNLGGVLILTYLYVIVRFGRRSGVRSALITLGVLSLLLTLSRSVILASLTVVFLAALLEGRVRLTTRGVAVSAAAVALFASVLLVSPATLDGVLSTADLLGNRLAFSEGSTSEHAAVMARAWEVGTADVKQLLMGIGYGNSYLVLQDIYPGNRYGNFHSLFMTLLAESGIFAALLALTLCAAPLVLGGGWRPLLAGLIVYNLFQQSQTDPTFWLVVTLAWMNTGDSRAALVRGAPPRPLAPAPIRTPQLEHGAR